MRTWPWWSLASAALVAAACGARPRPALTAGADPPPRASWYVEYDATGTQRLAQELRGEARAVAPVDGGVVVVGDNGARLTRLHARAVGLDRSGRVRWEHEFEGLRLSVALAAVGHGDTVYVAGDTPYVGEADVFVARLSAETGAVLWTRVLERPGVERCARLALAEDGGCVVAFSEWTGMTQRPTVIELDPQGKQRRRTALSRGGACLDVVRGPEGASVLSDATGVAGFRLTVLDATGRERAADTFPPRGLAFTACRLLAPDLVAGSTAPRRSGDNREWAAALWRVTGAGAAEHIRGPAMRVDDAARLADGAVLLAGWSTAVVDGSWLPYVAVMEPDGTPRWASAPSTPATARRSVRGACEVADGGVAVVLREEAW
ncbi:MAG: PQQ-binding-like beta-propeller repeat protein [Planctomycetes bacterium]|nr:PQQ-binding-like beta-propeller repeat protein [Planctomycetota bacterium]